MALMHSSVDAAARSVHTGIRHMHLQMAKAVLGQSDLGQMERLITEIPVTADMLFSGRLTNVIVEVATLAKNWINLPIAFHLL